MILYRSIGYSEINQLLNNQVINGRYNLFTEKQSTGNAKQAICFFVDKYFWRDKNHKFFIEVDLPDDELVFGYGTYYASANFDKTKIWTGRRGNTEYVLKEAYAVSYSSSHIKRICLNHVFANHFIKSTIQPWCEKYKISNVETLA